MTEEEFANLAARVEERIYEMCDGDTKTVVKVLETLLEANT